MRCRFCHNPDTWKVVSAGSSFIESGSAGSSSAGNGSVGCGTATSVEDLLNKAERYRSYWGADGGITVSGGEALLQIDFLIDLFEEAHRRGINTCLDTSAQPFTREEPFFSKFERLMQSTDLILLDIKHIDSQRHQWKHTRLRPLSLRYRQARMDPPRAGARRYRRRRAAETVASVH